MNSQEPKKKRGWKWWAFVLANLIGLVILIPLLRLAVPLASIWWQTRSPESAQANFGITPRGKSSEHPANRPSGISGTGIESNQGSASLDTLTNQLGSLGRLSDNDLQAILTRQFGGAPHPTAPASGFDMNSAVFDSISRTTLVYRGQTYYGYKIDLVDQHGLHKASIDCFTEPNADYERSLATMQLINQSPQLKRIYQAMAPSLATQSSTSGTTSPVTSGGPVLRVDPAHP